MEWAGRIVAGDLLTRDVYHPYPPGMQAIAPLETWIRWHGEHVFNKAPLYVIYAAVTVVALGRALL